MIALRGPDVTAVPLMSYQTRRRWLPDCARKVQIHLGGVSVLPTHAAGPLVGCQARNRESGGVDGSSGSTHPCDQPGAMAVAGTH